MFDRNKVMAGLRKFYHSHGYNRFKENLEKDMWPITMLAWHGNEHMTVIVADIADAENETDFPADVHTDQEVERVMIRYIREHNYLKDFAWSIDFVQVLVDKGERLFIRRRTTGDKERQCQS